MTLIHRDASSTVTTTYQNQGIQNSIDYWSGKVLEMVIEIFTGKTFLQEEFQITTDPNDQILCNSHVLC